MLDMQTHSSRLVILAGPSCAGKSPLDKALRRFHPQLRQNLKSLVLYNSRDPRPGELDGVDYHFRSRQEIADLESGERCVVMDSLLVSLEIISQELLKNNKHYLFYDKFAAGLKILQ